MAFASCMPLSTKRSTQQICTKRQQRCSTLSMQLGRVLVLGATRDVGLALIRALHGRSGVTNVIAGAQESSDITAAQQLTDNIIRLDLTDAKSVRAALNAASPRTLISCYARSRGIQTLVKEAESIDCVRRLMLVSALGCGDSETDVPAQVYFTMRDTMLDMSLAEAYVRQSNLDWSIARPGPNGDASSSGPVCTEGHKCYGTIHDADLADAVVRATESSRTIGRTLAMVDRGSVLLTSPYVRPLEFWESLPFDEFRL